MGKRQKRWAAKRRAELRELLGGCCARCKRRASEEGSGDVPFIRLEFDCVSPTGHAHHRMDASARTSFYNYQHDQGNLQLLCERCHARKTREDEDRDDSQEPDPF